jgi:pyruvate dehydrogenase E1 component alpha subunit
VDGNDPIAVYGSAQQAVQRARSGGGPSLIEAMTYRFHGHVFGDQDAYMDKDRKARAIADDPVPRFRAKLIAERIATEDRLAALEAGIEAEIDAAVEFALSSAFPSLEELKHDVFEKVMT